MLKEFSSYRKRKQAIINKKMANMRKAKESKRLPMPPPEYPVEIKENCFEITVRRYINGTIFERQYFLDAFKSDTFILWEIQKNEQNRLNGHYRKTLGQQKAFKLISSDFPKIKRY